MFCLWALILSPNSLHLLTVIRLICPTLLHKKKLGEFFPHFLHKMCFVQMSFGSLPNQHEICKSRTINFKKLGPPPESYLNETFIAIECFISLYQAILWILIWWLIVEDSQE